MSQCGSQEKNGVSSDLILQQISDKKQKINYDNYSSLIAEYNQAVKLFNKFILYRNKQFKPVIADNEIMLMIENPRNMIQNCQNNIAQFETSITDLKKQIDLQFDFVTNYINTENKLNRKLLFFKKMN